MKEIPLQNGMVALVDDEDYIFLSRHTWTAYKGRNSWYAVTSIGSRNIAMHMLVFPVKAPLHTDHHDGNGLNNQKYNLREASIKQNGCNRPPQSGRKYKGTMRLRNGFKAKIQVDGKALYSRVCSSEEIAAKEYDVLAKKHFGDFAYLNFPEPSTTVPGAA